MTTAKKAVNSFAKTTYILYIGLICINEGNLFLSFFSSNSNPFEMNVILFKTTIRIRKFIEKNPVMNSFGKISLKLAKVMDFHERLKISSQKLNR